MSDLDAREHELDYMDRAVHQLIERLRVGDEMGKEANRLAAKCDTLTEITRDLMQVAEWYGTLMRDVRSIAPEYLQRHPDPGAVAYLESEAWAILERARAVLAEEV